MAKQILDQKDVKSWANGIIPGANVPEDAELQLTHAKGIREARTFEAFRQELKIYTSASKYVYEAYNNQQSFGFINAFKADLARANSQNPEIFSRALRGDDSMLHNNKLETPNTKPFMVPLDILLKINKAYEKTQENVDHGRVHVGTYIKAKENLLTQLGDIPTQVRTEAYSGGKTRSR